MMLESRYLPIGTVCSIKNYNKSVMVIGYFSIVYNGNVKMYDYKACDFPEGMLLENKQISFNHSDILEILHYGLTNEKFNNFNTLLQRQENSQDGMKKGASVFSNILFDENGVVAYDGTVSENKRDDNSLFKSENSNESSLKHDFSNPFFKEYSDKEDDSKNSANWPIFKNIVFDENGIVISTEENE